MTVLLYVVAAYVAVCWLWGLYLAIRLYTGRRLSRLMLGCGVRTPLIRPTTTAGTTPHADAVEALAKSKAA